MSIVFLEPNLVVQILDVTPYEGVRGSPIKGDDNLTNIQRDYWEMVRKLVLLIDRMSRRALNQYQNL